MLCWVLIIFEPKPLVFHQNVFNYTSFISNRSFVNDNPFIVHYSNKFSKVWIENLKVNILL